MYQIEKEVIQLFKDNQVQVVEINMNGLSETITLTEKDIIQGGLTVDELCVTGTAFEFGTCCSDDITLTLSNSDGRFDDVIFEGAELFVRIGIKKWDADRWENAQLHYIPLGYFTIDETPRKLSCVILMGFDRMARFDKLYDSTLQYPATIDTILSDACKNCNVPLRTATNSLLNSNYKVTARPVGDNLTYRRIISWIAEITGTCAYIDREGKLDFKWYTPTGFSISAGDRYTSDVQESSITITGVKYTDSDKNRTVYLSGEDEYAISLAGNLLMQSDHQAIVNSLGNRINGFTYLPYYCTTKSYPFLEPLDMITFVDKKGVEHQSIITHSLYSINQNSVLKATGETARRKGYAPANPMTNAQLNMIGNIKNDMNGKMDDMLQATTALNDTITNSLGLYRTSVVLPDGSTKTYLHDKPTIEKSSTIYTMTEGGFAFTKSGWNNGKPVWQYGVDKDGNTVLNTIVANALTAVHITGGLIEGTTFKGGKIEALQGSSYFDLNNGKLYCDNAELSGTFAVNPTSNTSLKLRHGAEAVRFINNLWNIDGHGVGSGSNLHLYENASASFDYLKNGKVSGTVCFAENEETEASGLSPFLLFGCNALILEFGIGGNTYTSMTAPNEANELVQYINGTERSKYTDRGMTISNEITTDDVTFNSVEEIKTNISEAKNGAIDIIKKATVYNYDLKRDKAPKKRSKTVGNRYGFVIGREVPDELLAEGKESVSLYNTVALLTKAVQEQAEITRMQSNRIDELTDALEKLQEKSTP